MAGACILKKKWAAAAGLLCCLFDILSGGDESFDYFGFNFKIGRLDKTRLFLYNIVREIFDFAWHISFDHAFFGKRQFSALKPLKPEPAAAVRLPWSLFSHVVFSRNGLGAAPA